METLEKKKLSNKRRQNNDIEELTFTMNIYLKIVIKAIKKNQIMITELTIKIEEEKVTTVNM